ncbi:hypothetical protein AB0918_33160 [Streptomyces sp. NPDC006864]|uniref:hypothetical protein n=1 Tax=Streptomyces sp. NPDC006864 TaxID=3154780 RepID=UPI003455D161
MRENWRSKSSVLAGAAALALSAVTVTPALAHPAVTATLAFADDVPQTSVEVPLPADVRIVEGLTTEAGTEAPLPGDEGGTTEPVGVMAAKAAPPSNACLGATAAYGASGCFQHNGDIIWAGDTEKDGMSAAVGIYTDYGRAEEVCINKLGVNTWATCNKNYRESGNVRLRVLRYDGDTGKFYQPEATSGWLPVDGKF